MSKIFSLRNIFIFISFLLLTVITLLFFDFRTFSFFSIFLYTYILTHTLLILYLVYFDIKNMEVHNVISMILILSLLILNVSLFLFNGADYSIQIFNGYEFSPYLNLLSTLILGVAFQSLVLLSKERAMGQGDVRIAIIVGLIIGVNNIVLWLYATIFTALIYSILLAIKKGKFKGLKIPFVPFMIIGVLVVVFYNYFV